MTIHRFSNILFALATSLVAGVSNGQGTRYRDLVFAEVDVQSNVQYGAALNRYTQQTEQLLLDVYEPRGDQAGSRAAIVVVHGGGFVGGNKATPSMRQLATDYARRGFVAVSINYRLRPRGGQVIPQDVTDAGHDMKAAVRWLRSQATQLRIDTDRIAGSGSSAGAFTCCEAAYIESEGQSGNPGFSSELGAIVELWGGLIDLNQLEAGEAPVQIIHGTNDRTVPFQRGTDLDARAQAVGVTSELLPIQDRGHAPWSTYFADFHDDAIAFVYEHLRLGQLSGLSARPGASSPGTVTLDTFGVAGDLWLLMVSPGTGSLPLFDLGTLCLDASDLIPAASGTLPASPRLPVATFALPVVAGLAGQSFHWQAVHADPTALRLATNCVTTAF